MLPGEQFSPEKPIGGALSASAPPYIPGAANLTGPSGAPPVLELAAALVPATPDPWPAAREETPKVARRQLRPRQGPRPVTPSKAARAASQLRQLLDFYFEPFNLQHNRYLLDLLARKTPPPPKPGPWPSELLADFRFSFDDLMGLGRIASALAKLKLQQSEALGHLKHLKWSGDGRLQLRSPPEVRSFVAARSASEEAVGQAARYLAAVREQRGQVPLGMVSILSYALGDVLSDGTVQGAHRQAQLKRQILLYHTDIMCLFGLDAETTGSGLADSLVQEGYGYAWARSASGEANAVLWDRSRLEMTGHSEFGAAIGVDLRSLEDHDDVLRVVCVQPEVPTSTCEGPAQLFAGRPSGGPLVACVDLSLLGGAESAAVVEELASLRSLPREVCGEELQVPLAEPSLQDGSLRPVRAGASGLNRLHSPDSMLYEGLSPLLALSAHSEHHLATLPSEDVVQQFPAFRMPIVAAFRWASSKEEATEDAGDPAEPRQRVGSPG